MSVKLDKLVAAGLLKEGFDVEQVEAWLKCVSVRDVDDLVEILKHNLSGCSFVDPICIVPESEQTLRKRRKRKKPSPK